MKKITITNNYPLMWTEALRALVCMLPMFVASAIGETSYLVALGQGGFFFSTLFLPSRRAGRIVMGSLVLAFGLGFYLIGGTVAPNPLIALLFTFMVCLNLSFLSGWTVGGPLALTLVMIYTAGLNTGSPEKAADNFIAFAIVLGWSALISLLPFWTPVEPPKVNPNQKNSELAEQGFRMAIGASLALAVSYVAGFAKLGWAPSAVGSVVRYEEKLSRRRAWGRFMGTVGGAIVAAVVLALVTNITHLIWISALFAVFNGLVKKTKLGMIPFFYTATILLLYSANDLSSGAVNITQRIIYNLVGITIAMLVVLYPFPKLVKIINPKTTV